MSNSIITANSGIATLSQSSIVCPQCGHIHMVFDLHRSHWEASHQDVHCMVCFGQLFPENDEIELTLDDFTVRERSIYDYIKQNGPVIAENIADHFGMKTPRYIIKLMSPSGKFRKLGVCNKKNSGYYVHK